MYHAVGWLHLDQAALREYIQADLCPEAGRRSVRRPDNLPHQTGVVFVESATLAAGDQITPNRDKFTAQRKEGIRFLRGEWIPVPIAIIKRTIPLMDGAGLCIRADIDKVQLQGADAAELVDLGRKGKLNGIAFCNGSTMLGHGKEDCIEKVAAAPQTQFQMFAAAYFGELLHAQSAHKKDRTRTGGTAGFQFIQPFYIGLGENFWWDCAVNL